jgi:hypothetical protein
MDNRTYLKQLMMYIIISCRIVQDINPYLNSLE